MKTCIDIFHADSLTGPMHQLKQAFEFIETNMELRLTPGRSRELAAEILKGAACDIAAFSDEKVMQEEFMGKKIQGTDCAAASWYIVFSANQMVLIVPKGNPMGIRGIADLGRPDIRLVRVTGEKDLATYRTLELIKKAANDGKMPHLAEQILEKTAVKAPTIPEALQALKNGEANVGIVYLSSAVAEQKYVDHILLPDSLNLSEQIRNVLSIPGTSQNPIAAGRFVSFILSPAGQDILKRAGQPPQIPILLKGVIPPELDFVLHQ